FLDALKSGEHGAYIKNNFSEQFLNDFSMEEHLSFFQQVSMMHGGFKVHTIEKSSEDELIVIAKSQKRDAWRRIHLQTKPDPPHKLTLFGMDMADSPIESEAPPKKMTEREILDFVERELNTMSKE
ncbi:hypothetical protein GWO43_00750, partial [candidate division KSB1 bacterium]|nr:hypothetical protein [candidate division KSB1 bacterium]NIR69672.1 hypothetical protein [candidate division KSB1 bacterium]NIS22591.1 hypothetical protein [candidate division KSB1 bacterium]NIT69451.1 hypothetical protein [candidate division KSB1 bacterium]NIU23106.1 hypothetical protein [candidate division KSB1 bacterium]